MNAAVIPFPQCNEAQLDGLGTLYDQNGDQVSFERVPETLWSGEGLEVPNALAGNYDRVFKGAGAEEVKVVDWTSSAGDWCFAVKHGDYWYPAFQSNRYPRCGFLYSISVDEPHDSFEELCGVEEGEW